MSKEEQIDLVDWLKDVLRKKAGEGKAEFVDEAIAHWKEGEISVMTYGIERLFDEVEEKGIGQGIEKVAMKMLLKGKSLEEIQEVTDLTCDRIMELKEMLRDNSP